MQTAKTVDPKTDHYLDMTMLAIVVQSAPPSS